VCYACERDLIFFTMALALLISLSLDVYHLLKSTLFEPAILVKSALLFLFLEVDVHFLVFKFGVGRDQLAHIMIFGVVSDFYLDDLSIYYVWRLLLDGCYFAGAFVPHLDTDLNIHEFTCVNVSSL